MKNGMLPVFIAAWDILIKNLSISTRLKNIIKKAVQANIDGKDTVAYASNLLNLSTLYYTLHQADSANRCINTLIDIADSLNDLDLQVKIIQ